MERVPNVRDQPRCLRVMLHSAEVCRQSKSKLEVDVLVVVEETAHVRQIESCVPDDVLSHGDIHRVCHHPVFWREEGSDPQRWHAQTGGLQWQLQVSSIKLEVVVELEYLTLELHPRRLIGVSEHDPLNDTVVYA